MSIHNVNNTLAVSYKPMLAILKFNYMNHTVLQVYKKRKVVAVLGMNTMPNFRFMQKVHLDYWTYDKEKIIDYSELNGRVVRVKHKLISTTNYVDKKWVEPEFKTIVELHLF